MGIQPDMPMAPPKVMSLIIKEVIRAIADPWENPPRKIFFPCIPESISDLTMSLILLALSKMPCSSSIFSSGENEVIPNQAGHLFPLIAAILLNFEVGRIHFVVGRNFLLTANNAIFSHSKAEPHKPCSQITTLSYPIGV
ncbi:hypothetical protein HWI79_2059 [Cryptosporidium felis]|nr:hypothetical protein HWI79_2059 [Cryptosporidium felis]